MNNPKSDTPRTDEVEEFRAFGPSKVPAEFARALERENNALRADLQTLLRGMITAAQTLSRAVDPQPPTSAQADGNSAARDPIPTPNPPGGYGRM